MSELAVYEPSEIAVLPHRTGTPGSADFDSWVAVASEVIKLANVIYDTPFVPEGLRSGPATAAAILAGREMGLGPMTSLANIDVIKGRPAPKALLMRALIQAQGHSWQDGDVSDVRATVRGRRKGEAEWTSVTFTADQAKRAGIDLGRYPADKLYARATTRMARRKFADVIMGMPYSSEELADGDDLSDDGETITPAAAESNGHQPPPATAPAKTAQRKPRTRTAARPYIDDGSKGINLPKDQQAYTGPPLPGEDDCPVCAETGKQQDHPSYPNPKLGDDHHGQYDPAHPEQVKYVPEPGDKAPAWVGMIVRHFERLGVTDRDERLIETTRIAGRPEPVESTKDLTDTERKRVIDTLSRCRDHGQLVALLAEGQAPGERADA